jgi:hypothetical protein
MSLLDAFVIVSRPIKEIFYVNTEAITLISKFHPGVEIAIQPDTFDQDTKVILEVIVKEQFSNSYRFQFLINVEYPFHGFVDFSRIAYHHCLHFLFICRYGFIASGIIFVIPMLIVLSVYVF